MTPYSWLNPGTSGNWNVTTDWNPTGTPGAGTPGTDTVVLGNASAGYTVTILAGQSYNVSSLSITSGNGTGHTTNLAINGSLTTSTLAYGAGLAGENVTVGPGGLFDITTAITDLATPETISIVGTTASSNLELGGVGTNFINANVTFAFSNNTGAVSHGEVQYLSGFLTGLVVSQQITSLAWGDKIVFNGANFTGDTETFSGSTLTIKNGSTTVLQMTGLSGTGLTTASFALSGNSINVVCYAAGTRILTPAGEKPVESLMEGDIVFTLTGNELIPQTIKWLGHRQIDIASHPRPETVAPVCIQQGAFAENVPHHDLILSPDHAILVDGKLIAVRQLINGATIRQMNDQASVDYFHVELDAHAVLLAEGLPAESYLNTGNRGFFANTGEPMVLHPEMTDETDYPDRASASCHPFVWDEIGVKPVWERLASRAAALGHSIQVVTTTSDPALCLSVNGRTIWPLHIKSGVHTFALPKGATEVHVRSRAGSPTDTRPWIEDRRCLGVYIERIALCNAAEMEDIPVDHPGLSQGWWAVEQEGSSLRRWTDGDAVLSLPMSNSPAMLEIQASSGGMGYVVGDDQRQAA